MAKDILIVDDEFGVRELLKVVIRTMNLPVREASDGIEALDRIGESIPSLVILDLMMPRMDGIAVLRALRANPATASLPVMVFTAYNLPKEQAEENALKPNLVLKKGTLSVRELRDAVRSVLAAA